MKMHALIDSSAWIEFLRPDGDTETVGRVEHALREGSAAWCEMVMLELWNGAGNEEEQGRLRRLGEVLPVLGTSDEVWDRARNLAVLMRKSGRTVPPADLLIYATAEHNDARLIHKDRHFDWLQSIE